MNPAEQEVQATMTPDPAAIEAASAQPAWPIGMLGLLGIVGALIYARITSRPRKP